MKRHVNWRRGLTIQTAATLALVAAGCGRIGFDLLSLEGSGPRSSDAGRGPPGPPLVDAGIDAPVPCDLPCVNGDCLGEACVCDPGWTGELCDEVSPLGNGSDGSVVFSGLTNLSEESTGARACPDGGDAVEYSVTDLSSRLATLTLAPSSGCLSPGDAVLLSNRQGSGDAARNIGRYEFLVVESVTGEVVQFTTDKVHLYGTNEDEGLGTSAGTERVVLQRVPQYDDVTIGGTATVTANAWNGAQGGVLAFRAARRLRVDGRISMDGRGFRGGRATTAPGGNGAAGESYAGPAPGGSRNAGGGGGGQGDRGGPGCAAFGLPGAGGGHAEAGRPADAPACTGVSLAEGGVGYGDPLGARLYMGSGGGAGGANASLSENPPGGAGGAGGGIIIVFAGEALGTGIISATGLAGEGDAAATECSGTSTTDCWDRSGPGGGGAGGVIVLRSPLVSVGTLRVRGGAGGNGLDTEAGNGGGGSDGYPIVSGLP